MPVANFITNNSMNNSNFKFARRCDITGRGINEGWTIGNACPVYVADESEVERMVAEEGYASLEDAIDEDYASWHEWDFHEDGWYESEHENGTAARWVDPRQRPVFKFARRCSVTGVGMNEGYVLHDGLEYYASSEHLIQALRSEPSNGYEGMSDDFVLSDAYAAGAYYYTEWDADEDEDEWYVSYYEDGRKAVLVSAE